MVGMAELLFTLLSFRLADSRCAINSSAEVAVAVVAEYEEAMLDWTEACCSFSLRRSSRDLPAVDRLSLSLATPLSELTFFSMAAAAELVATAPK